MERIAAVVVTHNRFNLLKACVQSLRDQTRQLDAIIVVNNDSTDGTKEWLDSQNDLTVVHQKNLGGAGGFYRGMKLGFEKGYDYLWLMDDDGCPTAKCLNNLVQSSLAFDENTVLGCIVKPSPESTKLSFYTPRMKNQHFSPTNSFFDLKKEFDGRYYLGYASFFNGTFIPRAVIGKIGYPLKELFIWGDESEYELRCKKFNIQLATDTEALFLHPLNAWEPVEFLFCKEIFPLKMDRKAFYYFRNRFNNGKKYFHGKSVRLLFSQAIFYLIRFDIFSFKNLIIAYYYGLNSYLDRENPIR